MIMQSEELVQEEEDWNIIINEDTVMSKLMGLKENKSAGPDNIYSALLRNCARTVALPLSIILSEIIFRRYCDVPGLDVVCGELVLGTVCCEFVYVFTVTDIYVQFCIFVYFRRRFI